MAIPWKTIGVEHTESGVLELRQRGAGDWLLTLDGRVLMSSRANRSETALAEMTCAEIASRPRPRLLVGGLGMGYTLRAALDALPANAQVTVAELTPAIARWCQTELIELHGNALADPRVELRIEDVTTTIRHTTPEGRFDAILYDLYEGPGADDDRDRHPLYGYEALRDVRAALRPGGLFSIWAEQPYPPFAARLRKVGFRVRTTRPGRGGLRHAVYLAVAEALPAARPAPVKRSNAPKWRRR